MHQTMIPSFAQWAKVLAICLFFISMNATLVRSQTQMTTGTIQGTVTDSTGGLVPEAKVTLTNTESGKIQETTSSQEGFYRLSGLPPGKYKLTVEKSGYRQKVFDDVAISAEATQGLDVALDVGDVSAVVTISQETAQTLETENANVDKGITTQEIRRLPQFGRDPYELTRLTPGIFGDFARGGAGGAAAGATATAGAGTGFACAAGTSPGPRILSFCGSICRPSGAVSTVASTGAM